MLAEARTELEDFRRTSEELEAELEAELTRTEKAHEDLKAKAARAELERDEWKVCSPFPASPHTPTAPLCPIDEVHDPSNDPQHHLNFSAARIRQTPPRISADQGCPSRAGDG